MSTVQEIEDTIEALPQEAFFKIAGWMSERFSKTRDRQIEDDIRAGLQQQRRPAQNGNFTITQL